MQAQSLERLRNLVRHRPIVAIRFDHDEWKQLRDSRRGDYGFTATFYHSLLANVKTPTLCLVEGDTRASPELLAGAITSKTAVSTLQSRVRIAGLRPLARLSLSSVGSALTETRYARAYERRFTAGLSVVVLSPELSARVVDSLSKTIDTSEALLSVSSMLTAPTRFDGPVALQESAVRTALKTFGISDEDVVEIDVENGAETALRRIWIAEDAVIEHDARDVPDLELVESYVTGRAVFARGGERLEVITANKRPLEQVFGVDLILVNLVHESVVMLQYKMLESDDDADGDTDWFYRPDAQLDDEIERMRVFDRDLSGDLTDYRLNPGMFFLKFVRRDAAMSGGGIITSLDHFECLRSDPSCRGPRDGFRITFRSLGGRYLRERPFLDLVRSGYVGARAATTAQLRPLIEAVLHRDRAVIAAIKSTRKLSESEDSSSDEWFEEE